MTKPKLSKVERAAIRWWRAASRAWLVPIEAAHLIANPDDRRLARAVAELLKARKGKR